MKGVPALAAVNPAVPLAVVVLVSDPGVEAAAALGRDDVHRCTAFAFVEPVDVPLAEVSGVIAGLLEGLGDGGLALRQRVFVARDAVVRPAAGEHGATEGAAEGEARDGVLEVGA